MDTAASMRARASDGGASLGSQDESKPGKDLKPLTRGRLSEQRDLAMISAAIQAHEVITDNKPHFNGHGNIGEDRRYWAENRRQACLWSFVFAMLGLVLAIVENEVRWQTSEAGVAFDTLSEILKGCILATSIVTILLIYKYYEALIQSRRLSGILLQPVVSFSTLKGAGFLAQFLIDVALMIPQPLPGVDIEIRIMNQGLGKKTVYDLDSLMLCIMMCRILYIPRFYGEFLSDLRSDASLAVGRINRVDISESFIMKHLIASSLHMVTLLTVLQITLFAYVLMIFERPTDDGTLRHYANCVWLIIITMTTVGYGDEYPTTFLGRVVVVMAAASAVIMLAITINLVISSLSLTRSECKVLDMVDSIMANKELRNRAAKVMQRWFRSYKACWTLSNLAGEKRTVLSVGKKRTDIWCGDFRTSVLSDVGLLQVINSFAEAKASDFRSRIEADIPDIVGMIQAAMENQEKQTDEINNKCEMINSLVAELIEARGG